MNVRTGYRRAVLIFGRQPTNTANEEEMPNRTSIKEVEQAIAGGRCIAVRADQVIWSYAKTNKGWVRVRTELSSPEAAERRLVAYADEGDLILDAKANRDPTTVLKWFDEVVVPISAEDEAHLQVAHACVKHPLRVRWWPQSHTFG